VIIVADPQRVDADLAADQVACPHCGGRLRPWAYARARRVRVLHGGSVTVRPRRARCAACSRTQVLLPGAFLPRRADAVEVVGTALLAKASGRGHRRIAADLDRSPSTVRRWLRAVRARGLSRSGTRWSRSWCGWYPDAIARLQSSRASRRRPGDLGDALGALGETVQAVRTRLPDLLVSAWSLIGAVTAGQLLAPAAG
jgi:hypothetical protein